MADESQPIFEGNVHWEGSHESLESWKQYKRAKVLGLVDRGYSVEWRPDADNIIAICVPPRRMTDEPELRAEVLFFSEPSRYGIHGGKVSKLWIGLRDLGQPGSVLSTQTVYNYDRGPDVNRLSEHEGARRLYEAVIEALN
jgi:hypothetical protein